MNCGLIQSGHRRQLGWEHETFVGDWVTFQRGLTIFYSVRQVKKRP